MKNKLLVVLLVLLMFISPVYATDSDGEVPDNSNNTEIVENTESLDPVDSNDTEIVENTENVDPDRDVIFYLTFIRDILKVIYIGVYTLVFVSLLKFVLGR